MSKFKKKFIWIFYWHINIKSLNYFDFFLLNLFSWDYDSLTFTGCSGKGYITKIRITLNHQHRVSSLVFTWLLIIPVTICSSLSSTRSQGYTSQRAGPWTLQDSAPGQRRLKCSRRVVRWAVGTNPRMWNCDSCFTFHRAFRPSRWFPVAAHRGTRTRSPLYRRSLHSDLIHFIILGLICICGKKRLIILQQAVTHLRLTPQCFLVSSHQVWNFLL